MHRVTERVFEGTFDNGKSEGKGRMITTVIDTEFKQTWYQPSIQLPFSSTLAQVSFSN